MKKRTILAIIVAGLSILVSILILTACGKSELYDYSKAEEKYKAEQALSVSSNWDENNIKEWNRVNVWYKEIIVKEGYLEGYMVIYEGDYLFVCVNAEASGSLEDCKHNEYSSNFDLIWDDYGCANFNNILFSINKLEIVKRAIPSTRVVVEPIANKFLENQKGTITDIYVKTEEDGDYEILYRTKEYGWYYEQRLGNEVCSRVYYSNNSLEYIMKDMGEHFNELIKIL